jgi:hypothetical protein
MHHINIAIEKTQIRDQLFLQHPLSMHLPFILLHDCNSIARRQNYALAKYMHDSINLYARLNQLFASLIGGKEFKLGRSKYI